MNVRFIFPADLELDEAINYYNYQITGLGNQFYSEVNQAIERIIKFPKAWVKVGSNTRRCLIKKFPYALLYAIYKNADILILAFAHLHRDPQFYKDRLR